MKLRKTGKNGIACKLAAFFMVAVAGVAFATADSFELQRAEFAKYYRQITGRDAPDGAVSFAVDPTVSKSGRDAYAIKSGKAVTITGSNVRSVWYGLYDLLERRGGCHWFWDGDVVPKKDTIDFSNLDIHEEARFEYRGLRYFAHRGLTRFQAEHWGPEDWKKEIDWILKRRLNVFMLRIGQDDLFQLAFPDACAYPDPSKPQPGAGKGYNDRSLFWSLQFRGKLRRDLQKYGFERGLMVPEDYGTMTHWYAPTPLDYIANRKPPFYPGADSRPENNRVWDVRDDRWIDEYWKMTKTAVETYGKGAPKPQLLHTIGTGERILSKDKKENFKLKVLGLQRFMSRVERDYPEAKLLMPGWDFYFSWTPQEVKDFLKLLDPKKCIVWDYSADQKTGRGARSNFTKWDVIGKFPYTYSIFLAYEKALDARADYPIIEERQKLVQNDPFCVGYIFWPESSHTDTLLLRYFTANAWSDKAIPHGEVLDEFCASRYGNDAETMKAAWKAVLPASWLRDWTTTYADKVLGVELGDKKASHASQKWRKAVAEAEKVFGMLAEIEWNGEFIQRDTIDIARVALDRIICLRRADLSVDVAKWRRGECKVESVKCKVEGGNLVARANQIAALCDLMADLLALHTDYSLWESYQRLDAVEKIRNPNFSKTLFENASCGYCRSHQYEFARYWYAPHARITAKNLAKAIASGDREARLSPPAEPERIALKAKPLEALKPTLPRTEENFRKVMRAIAELVKRQGQPPVNKAGKSIVGVGVPQDHEMWRKPVELCRGVTLRAYALDNPRLMKAYVARIDLGEPGIGFTATDRAANWGDPMPDYTNKTVLIDTKRETTPGFLMRRRAEGVPVVLAVNSSPWYPWDCSAAYRSTYGAFRYWNVSHGVEISHGKNPARGAFFVVYKDGKADISPSVPKSRVKDVDFALCGFGLIMTNGVPTNYARRVDPKLPPRTVFGLDANRRTLVLLVVDGRQPGYSLGALGMDLYEILRAEGVTDAVNMDGGGSSTLSVFDAASGKPWTLNRPSDGRPRRNALNFGVSVK